MAAKVSTPVANDPLAPALSLLSNRVLVIEADADAESPGGIVLPEDARERQTVGRVVLVGPGFRNPKTGVLEPMTVAVGDEVVYGQHAGRVFAFEGVDYRIFDESEIIAVVDG